MADITGQTAGGLSATQFVLLADAQRQKAALADQQVQYQDLIAANRQLQEQHEVSLRDNFEVTEFLRREILTKDGKITLLQSKMEEVKAAAAAQVAAAKQASNEAKARVMADAARQIEESQREVAQIKEQLAAVLDYKQRKEVLEEEVAKLQADSAKYKADTAQQMAEVEKQYVDTSQRLRKEFESKLVEVRRAGEEDVHLRMNAGTKRVMQHNRSLQEELRIHIEASTELDAEVKKLSAERQGLAAEVQLKREIEQQYAKRCTFQAREEKERKQKIAALESSLQQVLQDFEAERKLVMQKSAEQVAEAQTECNSLKRLLKLRTHELKNIRRLAHEVLLQRSDVEIFLVSSLKQVRDQIEKENVSQQPRKGPPPLPPAGQKIDIKELAWEDREKVLRLLFAKINNQTQQSYYSHLPEHSFQIGNIQEESLQGLRTEAGPAQIV